MIPNVALSCSQSPGRSKSAKNIFHLGPMKVFAAFTLTQLVQWAWVKPVGHHWRHLAEKSRPWAVLSNMAYHLHVSSF